MIFTLDGLAGIMVEDNTTYTINSRFNVDRAKVVFQCLDIVKEHCSGGKKLDALVPQLKYIINYGKLSGTTLKFSTKHKTSGSKGMGRLTVQNGYNYVQITRPVRHFMAEGIYSDHDIVNCHPVIARQLMDLFGIDGSPLDQWNANREQYFQRMIQASCHKLTRDDCKTLGFVFLYRGNLDYTFQKLGLVEGISDIYKVAEGCLSAMNQLSDKVQARFPAVWDQLYSNPTKDDPRAGKFSSFMQHIERHLALICYHTALKDFGYEVGDFAHDGLFLCKEGKPIENPEPYHRACERNIESKTGLRVQLVSKTVVADPWFNALLENPELLQNVESQYDILKAKFEETHCKIINMAQFALLTTEGYKFMKREQLKTAYEHLLVKGKTTSKGSGPFINAWLCDPNIKTYENANVYPPGTVCPPNTLNLWQPFAVEKITDYTTVSIDKILDHIKNVLCKGDNLIYEYVLDWISGLFVEPSKKGPILVWISKPGVGKTIFMEFLKALLGTHLYFETSDPNRDVWGAHNVSIAGKLLVNISEAGKADVAKSLGKLKALVTDPTITLNPKGKDQYVQNSYHHFIWTTNNMDPIPTDNDDRRTVLIRCSDEMIGNYEYFNELTKLTENPNVQRSFYDYLLTRPKSAPLLSTKLPVTAFGRALRENNDEPVENWLKDYLCTLDPNTQVAKFLLKDALMLFDAWAQENNTNSLSTRSLKKQLTCLDLPDYKEYKSGGQIKISFDAIGARRLFKINDDECFQDKPDDTTCMCPEQE